MNRFFALLLFVAGIGLIVVGACGNLSQLIFLDTWGIVWRIGLGLVLIVIGVVLANIDGIGPSDPY